MCQYYFKNSYIWYIKYFLAVIFLPLGVIPHLQSIVFVVVFWMSDRDYDSDNDNDN